MNKSELIDAIASNSGLTKKQSKEALEGFVTSVKASLKTGDKISLVGFGSFSVNTRSARTGHNPRTKAVINIPAKKVIRFKPGSELADHVN